MNKCVQILLLCAVLPLASHAREETLEERKQRIMRKYMREQATVSESELYVPAEQPEEDEAVTASEEYSGIKEAFDRQESSSMPTMPRRPMPMPRQPERSNWVFDDVEMDEESDPYADPFALDKPEKKLDVKKDWSQWNRSEQESSSIYGSGDNRYGSSYGRQQDQSRTSTYRSYLNPGTEDDAEAGSTSLYGSRDSSPYGTRSSGTYSTGRLGQQQESRTYGSSPSSGLLTSPYPQLNSGDESDSQQQGYPSDRTRGYTPSYRTPSYSTTDEQQRSWGSTPSSSSQSEQQQEYQQPSSFQKWKQREKYDPAAKDPFGQ
jgi:hypothetical protein